MLILGRHVDERIIINGNVSIVVVEARANYVRLGIEAPPEVTVNREEVEVAKLVDGSIPPISRKARKR